MRPNPELLFFAYFNVSEKQNIKRSTNGIKRTENYFGIFGIFWRKNQQETVPEVATRQGARLPTLGAP